MVSLTEVTLQLIYKKLDEILTVIKGHEKILNEHDKFPRKEKHVSQEQFIATMKEVVEQVNKKKL